MNKEIKKGEIIIYKDQEGPEIQVKLEDETVWMTQEQIAQLFAVQKAAISRHIKNIYISSELSENRTVSKMETVQIEGKRAVRRHLELYNLDMIISIGYRVNSKRATQFRIWATTTLRDYLIKGYVVNEDRLKQLRQEHDLQLKELQETTALFRQVLESQRAEGYEKDLLQIITDYAYTWSLLNRYDKDELDLAKVSKKKPAALDYAKMQKVIVTFKSRLKQEAGNLFGREVGEKFRAILGNIDQTFGGKDLYKSAEEKAAHLLYFVIKDHPFTDGNKRIGSLLFMLYLVENNLLYSLRTGDRKFNDNALAALALLIAESHPQQKSNMVQLVVNLVSKK